MITVFKFANLLWCLFLINSYKLSVDLAAETKKKLVGEQLPDLQIYSTNQRLFNENKASFSIIIVMN